jgi:hypothetical protein
VQQAVIERLDQLAAEGNLSPDVIEAIRSGGISTISQRS